MTYILPTWIRDRRRAASEEVDSVQLTGESQARVVAARQAGSPRPADLDYSPIYGRGSAARSHGASRAPRFDRDLSRIRAVVLHQTAGATFDTGRQARRLADTSRDSDPAHDLRVDRISCHFLVLQSGQVIHTHDMRYIINSAGGSNGIDIEFCGRWNHGTSSAGLRLEPQAINSARMLIKWLAGGILPNLGHIYPHGQIQAPDQNGRRGKAQSCPGPDIWVNVGLWCTANLGLSAAADTSLYPNATDVDPAQTNARWDQHVAFPG
ncbi:peptidoglycan recognition family protein [Tropicimonas sp. IMCC6043]|uniref:peptidoglycan recognition protein family protein n=1 Tax=Tropicimonas sp. IMCC6043 TaxID=2510645 RepID=UPI00101C3BA3|nr:peptidoglycan recognition family protein [Tropicimonas sp. IMCC6043]RYH10363.1 N-acetylmuramoyl-L-alanine amidase [Tropicimonas sp. IMCC6043]